ncbi:hypothetical protein V8G54_035705 [Vigna mungo]|uniref:Uncharacterized protein n=1 Tax=Vigna mungo TaxID=3915 RepID=A0AAQ3RDJ4_VIGMU
MSPQGLVRLSISPQGSIMELHDRTLKFEKEPDFKNDGKKTSHVLDVVFLVIGAIFVVSMIGFLVFCLFRMKQKLSRVQNRVSVGGASETRTIPDSEAGDIQMVEAGNMVIFIQVLRNATNNFSEKNILGKGGF